MMENLTRARKALSYLESVEQRIAWLKEPRLEDRRAANIKFMLAELRNAQTLIKNMEFLGKPQRLLEKVQKNG